MSNISSAIASSMHKPEEKPVAKKRMGLYITETLRQRILQWDYPPCHALKEETLSHEFAVSRSPVREALHALHSAGLICRMSNRSYMVKQMLPTEIDELYDVRLALELYALNGLKLETTTLESLSSMLRDWEAIPEQPWNSENMAKADQLFHETLASLYGNTSLLKNLKHVNQQLFIFRLMDFAQQDRLLTTTDHHASILKALLKNNKDMALSLLKENVEFARSYVDTAIRDALLRAYSKTNFTEAE